MGVPDTSTADRARDTSPTDRARDASLAERIRALVAAHRDELGALLPILHDVQAEFGHVDQEMVSLLATELNLSRADVHGVVTFYSDFRAEPAGRTVVRLCRAEACRSVGAEQLVAYAQRALGIAIGQTAADGAVTLEQVFCLGNCALGPAAQIDGRLHGRLDPRRLDALLAAARPEPGTTPTAPTEPATAAAPAGPTGPAGPNGVAR